MITVITIRMEGELKKEQQDELRVLFADALGDFKAGRTPVQEYFQKRYGNGHVYKTDAERAKKMAQIDRRVSLANMLHNPVLNLTVTQEEGGREED